MNKISGIKEKIALLLRKKKEEIDTLKAQLNAEKQKSHQEVYIVGAEKIKLPEPQPFPKKMEVEGKVEIKNFPEKQKVELEKPSWWKNPPEPKEIKFPEKIKIDWENKPKEKEQPSWLESFIDKTLEKLAKLLAILWKKPITIKRAEEDRLKPQIVIQIDPETGKPIGKPVINIQTTGGNIGGSGYVKNKNGNLINPATEDGNLASIKINTDKIQDSLDNYKISDIDDASNPKYYGFLDKDGNWYILQENTINKTYRYAKGSSNYSDTWTNRASLTYDYFDVVF